MHRFAILASLLAVAAGCTSTGIPAEADVQPKTTAKKAICETPEDVDLLIIDVLDLVNTVREAEGLHPLVLEPILSSVAADFACEMVEDDFFAHQNPATSVTPGERLTAAGYIYYVMGENLAAGQPTAEQVVADWLDSPAHRANILSPEWREVGIAVRTGGSYGWYWVQEFADPVEFAGR